MKIKNLSIRFKLITVFVLIALVPLLVLAILNGRNAQQALMEDANQALFAVASQTASSLDTFITSNLNSIQTESQLPQIVNYILLHESVGEENEAQQAVLELLNILLVKDPNINSYAILDNQGNVILDTQMTEAGLNKSDRPYFSNFIGADMADSFVSDVEFSPVTGKPSLYFSSPVIGSGSDFLGVLRVRYSASVLQTLLEEKNDLAGEGSFGVLFDDFHIHLAHGVAPEVNFLPIVPFDASEITELLATRRLMTAEDMFNLELYDLEEHLANPETQRFFEAEDIATGDKINQVAIAEMTTRPWLVTFFQPQEIFLAPVRAQTRNTVIFSGFIAVIAVIGAVVLGQNLGRPLTSLSNTVSEFSHGELSARSSIESTDEIGVLAAAFNQMAEQVGSLLTDVRTSEERYRITSELTSDYIYSIIVKPDDHFELDWATDAFTKLTGYTTDELSERGGWNMIIHPDDREYYGITRKKLLSTGKSDVAEYRIITKDHRIRWLRDHRRPTWDKNEKRVTTILGAAYDYTSRRQAQEELAKMAAIVENSNDAILSAAPDGTVLSWNPAAERMFGFISEEAIGENLPKLILPENDRDAAPDLFEIVSEGGHVNSMETLRITKDKKLIDVSATLSPINDKDGEIIAIAAIMRDISDQKQAELELQRAKEAAESANRSKSIFLANMSHELRTPLNAILGFAQLLIRDQTLAAEQRENLEIINRSGEHLLSLINDILELSKIEAGRSILKKDDFDLHRHLDDLENMFKLRAGAKSLSLIFDLDPNLPRYIRSDEGKLRQVLINLLSNAVKFTSDGGVSVRAKFITNETTPTIAFEVEDTGAGISQNEIDTLFEAFIQTTSGENAKEGTGLGLSISRHFVKLLGGEIMVSSEEGRGSIFRFEIPFQPAESVQTRAIEPNRRAVGLEPGQLEQKILVVEDQPENRRLLVRLLKQFGFQIKEAANGKEGVDIWKEWNPNLIWMDMRMPVMDGYEATREIKATTQGQATTIIAITASAFEEDRHMILSAGIDDFVRKPFRQQEIFDMLTKHLGVKFIYQETGQAPIEPENSKNVRGNIRADIPSDLLQEIYLATIRADIDSILKKIERMKEISPEAAETISELARNFEYERIIALTEPREEITP